MIPKSWDWGNGRFGIGPLVTLPGNEQVARDGWGYGLASVVDTSIRVNVTFTIPL